MYGQYIPDLTERFPEGFGGVDLTDRYFPTERDIDSYYDEHYWDAFERECRHNEEEFERDFRDYNFDEEEEDFVLR